MPSVATLKIFGARVFILLISVSSCRAGPEQIDITEGTTGRFASVARGARILTAKDDFVRRLSPFDRAARVKTDRTISETEFLKFVRANVAEWTREEMGLVETAVAKIRPALASLALPLPQTVDFIKTTGAEEGNAFYTRDMAVVLPQSHLKAEEKALEKAIAHELFHILSRTNPQLREALYEMIGFRKCDELQFPASLTERKITNPDAPRNDHYIRLNIRGRETLAVPVLFAEPEKYSPARGGEFFDYLQFKFLLVEKKGGSAVKFLEENSAPVLVSPKEVSGFFEQIGRNTTYVIHPEEVLAENFALLLTGAQNVASPEILIKMRQILGRKKIEYD